MSELQKCNRTYGSKVIKNPWDTLEELLRYFNDYLGKMEADSIYEGVNHGLVKNRPKTYFIDLFRKFKKSIDYRRKPALDRLISEYLKSIFDEPDDIDEGLNSINNILKFYYLYNLIENPAVIKYLNVKLCNIHSTLYMNSNGSLEVISQLYDRGIKFNKISRFTFLSGILVSVKLDSVRYLVENTDLGFILNETIKKVKKLKLESNMYFNFIKLIVDRHIEVTDEIIEKLEYVRLELLGGINKINGILQEYSQNNATNSTNAINNNNNDIPDKIAKIPNSLLNYVIQESTVFNKLFIDYLVNDIGLTYNGRYYNKTSYCRVFINMGMSFSIEHNKHVLVYFIGCYKNLKYVKNVLEYFPDLKITPNDLLDIKKTLKNLKFNNDIDDYIINYINNI